MSGLAWMVLMVAAVGVVALSAWVRAYRELKHTEREHQALLEQLASEGKTAAAAHARASLLHRANSLAAVAKSRGTDPAVVDRGLRESRLRIENATDDEVLLWAQSVWRRPRL